MTTRSKRAANDDAGASSQSMRAQLRLREMVVDGELGPGTRLTELAMVERLAMSRTPIRTALVRLQEEGLLEPLPGGGFAVRAFSEEDIHDAIELRGTLEGLAARLAAERGTRHAALAGLRECLAAIDALLASPKFGDATFAAYAEHNGRFHALLVQASGSALVQRQIERVVTMPFASPNGFVMADRGGPRARDRLVAAHAQHHAIVEAIVRREGTRAESVTREHARNAQRNLADVLATPRRGKPALAMWRPLGAR